MFFSVALVRMKTMGTQMLLLNESMQLQCHINYQCGSSVYILGASQLFFVNGMLVDWKKIRKGKNKPVAYYQHGKSIQRCPSTCQKYKRVAKIFKRHLLLIFNVHITWLGSTGKLSTAASLFEETAFQTFRQWQSESFVKPWPCVAELVHLKYKCAHFSYLLDMTMFFQGLFCMQGAVE